MTFDYKEYRKRPEAKAYRKEYSQRPEVKAKHRISQKKYYNKNTKKYSKYMKVYRAKNRDLYLEYMSDYQKERVRKLNAKGLTGRGTPFKVVNGINLSQIRKSDGKPFGAIRIKQPRKHKQTEFYKQYGITGAEMARRVGITKEAVRRRFVKGLKVDDPINKSKAETFEGKTIREWAKELNVSIGSMTYRIKECKSPHYLPKEKPKSKPKQLSFCFSWDEKEQKILEKFRLGQIIRKIMHKTYLEKKRELPEWTDKDEIVRVKKAFLEKKRQWTDKDGYRAVIESGPYKGQWKARK